MVNKFLHANGGSETYVFELGQYLNEHGHEVQYFGMDHPNRIMGNGINCYTNNMDFHSSKLQKLFYPFKILYSLEAKKKITKVLEDFNPDVVHVNNFNFQLTPSILYGVRAYEKKQGKKIKIVFTAHDSQLVCPNHLMYNEQSQTVCMKCMEHDVGECAKYRCIHGSRIKSILGVMEAKIYRWLRAYQMIDVIISPSQFLAKRLATHRDLKGRIVVIQNFLSAMYTMGEVKEVYNKKHEPYALYFGRYSSEKGIDFLMKVCQQLPQITFYFAGIGPLEEQLKDVANIHNVGFQSGQELKRLIQHARFSLCTSTCYENCPYSVLESQALGTPVIGVNQGGVTELIRQGKTGYLYTPMNALELQNQIKELWEHTSQLEQMSEYCKNQTYMTLAYYTEELVKLYNH